MNECCEACFDALSVHAVNLFADAFSVRSVEFHKSGVCPRGRRIVVTEALPAKDLCELIVTTASAGFCVGFALLEEFTAHHTPSLGVD